MRSRLFLLLLPAVFPFLALQLLSQSPTAVPTTTCNSGPCRPGSPPLPFTAQFKETNVQTLANGTTITRITNSTEARDSEGRIFHLTTTGVPRPDGTQITVSNFEDPVAGTQGNWNSNTKKARVITFPPFDQRTGCWRTESGTMTVNYGPGHMVRSMSSVGLAAFIPSSSATAVLPQLPPQGAKIPVRSTTQAVSSDSGASLGVDRAVPANKPQRPQQEDLGTSTIEGVEVHGYRTIMTIPVGKIGNDQPIVNTDETWMARSLGLNLRTISDSPQSGKNTREVVSLQLGEPDPTMFEPPEGYEVVREEMIPCKE